MSMWLVGLLILTLACLGLAYVMARHSGPARGADAASTPSTPRETLGESDPRQTG